MTLSILYLYIEIGYTCLIFFVYLLVVRCWVILCIIFLLMNLIHWWWLIFFWIHAKQRRHHLLVVKKASRQSKVSRSSPRLAMSEQSWMMCSHWRTQTCLNLWWSSQDLRDILFIPSCILWYVLVDIHGYTIWGILFQSIHEQSNNII